MARVKQRMADSLGRTQNYLCSESIERTARVGKGAAAALAPLRIDSGVVDGRELYTSPSNDTDAATLTELIGQFNTAGTGSYAMYARAVFLSGAASFYDAPEEVKDGRKLLRWDFRVPREASKHTLHGNAAGYSGTMWADAETLDLVRLELQADDIPPELGIKSAIQTFQYARASIAEISVVLPTATELVLVESGGREVRIQGRFADCRKYAPSRSVKLIDLAQQAGPSAPASGEASDFPEKTRIELMLDAALDEKTTAVNDPITFRVAREIKKGGAVVVPKGALASGRLTRISRQAYRVMDSWKDYYVIGIQLDSIESGGQRFRVVANLETVGPTTTLEFFLPFSQSADKWGAFEEVRDQLSFPTPQPGESILGLVRPYMRIPKGLRMMWTTGDSAK